MDFCHFEQEIERQLVDQICKRLELLPSKTLAGNEQQQQIVSLEYYEHIETAPSLPNRVYNFAELRLDNIGSKNALSGKIISQLTKRIDELDGWCARCYENEARLGTETISAKYCGQALLVRGSGGTFCSGSDLVSVRSCANQLAGLELAQVMQFNCARLARLPIISVAFIDGYALGGGAELALAADFRLMSPDAKIGFVHARNGICCGWGGASRLRELTGQTNALELLTSGRLVGAHEAKELGLVSAIVANENSLESVHKFMAEHALESVHTLKAVKATLMSTHNQRERALERNCFASTWGNWAHLKALKANQKHGGGNASNTRAKLDC